MKKFLSLALSLVMTLSLVTISAGATEYADLTDKDEIHYEEAVAVLNRIGVITGYEDGSFKPEAELSRGAAAKIIVSLLIGPEAAENLGNTNSPYPDVPAGNNFAGVISFCKTSGIINGYGDGTFRPTANLTGYAFAKMLLGALGYSVDIEGMSGDGWNMVVANLGQAAGLFDRLKFNGNDPVNREMACQMALNTLKANLVEYTGGFTVSAGDAQVVGAQTRIVKSSNQDYAKNIRLRNDVQTDDDYYTVQFAEEHFVDLRLTHNKWNPTDDNFGNPSTEWDYRKVTIGTFPLEADYSYTTKVADKDKSTDASKVRALGLSGFKITDDTQLYINGKETATTILQDNGKYVTGKIADLTDNGTLVKVYIDNNVADVISAIVVIKSQLMEIKRVGSDFVSLDKYDGGEGADDQKPGFNEALLDEKVSNVEVNDDYYSFLSEKKAGDLVVIIPVTVDHNSNTYEVGGAYTPETVSGTLTRVTTYGEVNNASNVGAIDVTLGGTKYPVALWNAGDLNGVTADIIDVTKKDVTLYLDMYGNAMLADEVGSQDGYMVIKGFYSTLVNGKIATMVEGWDVGGDELSLNLGNSPSGISNMAPGDLVKYDNSDVSSSADWKLIEGDPAKIYDVDTDDLSYEIKASNLRVRLDTVPKSSPLTVSGVKFIYVTFDDDGDAESIEIKNGVQNVERSELIQTNTEGGNKWAGKSNPAEAYLNGDGLIKAVVIKQESNEAISNNLLYVRDVLGTEGVDANGDKIYGYTVARMSADGLTESETIYSTKKLNRGDFASYALSSHSEFDPFYTLKQHTATKKTTSVNMADVAEIVNNNNNLLRLGNYGNIDTDITGDYRVLGDSVDGNETNVINVRGAKWLDIATTDGHIDSADELEDYLEENPTKTVRIQFIYNDNKDSDGFRTVSLVVVTRTEVDRPVVGTPITSIIPESNGELKLGNVAGTSVTRTPGAKDGDNETYTVSASFTMTSAQAQAITKANVAPASTSSATLSILTVKEAGDAAATSIPNNAAANTELMSDAADTEVYTIQYRVTAANGDYATYTLTVTIEDTLVPEVLVPAEDVKSASEDANYSAVVTNEPTKSTVLFTQEDGKDTTATGIEIERQSASGVQMLALDVNVDGNKLTITGIDANGVTNGTGEAAGVTITTSAGTDAIAKDDFMTWEVVAKADLNLVQGWADGEEYFVVANGKTPVDDGNGNYVVESQTSSEFEAASDTNPDATKTYYVKKSVEISGQEKECYVAAVESDFKWTLPAQTDAIYASSELADADLTNEDYFSTNQIDAVAEGAEYDSTKTYYTAKVAGDADVTEGTDATVKVEMTKDFLNDFLENGAYVLKSVKVVVDEGV